MKKCFIWRFIALVFLTTHMILCLHSFNFTISYHMTWNWLILYEFEIIIYKKEHITQNWQILTRLLAHLMFSWEDFFIFNWIYDAVKENTVWKNYLRWHITFSTGGVKEEKLIIFAKFCGNTFLLILMAHIIYFSFQIFEPIQGLRIFQHSANKPIHA